MSLLTLLAAGDKSSALRVRSNASRAPDVALLVTTEPETRLMGGRASLHVSVFIRVQLRTDVAASVRPR